MSLNKKNKNDTDFAFLDRVNCYSEYESWSFVCFAGGGLDLGQPITSLTKMEKGKLKFSEQAWLLIPITANRKMIY